MLANLLLLRQTFGPIHQFVERMRKVDLLWPGQRLDEERRHRGRRVGSGRCQSACSTGWRRERRESGRQGARGAGGRALRIARGLHDEVGQVLTGVLLQLDSLARLHSGLTRRRSLESEAGGAAGARGGAADRARAAARDARAPGARQRADRAVAPIRGPERHPRRPRFGDGLPPLSERELAVYRVAQESLTNVARHAQASNVDVARWSRAGSVVLRVSTTDAGSDTGRRRERPRRPARDAGASAACGRRARGQATAAGGGSRCGSRSPAGAV